MRLLSIILMMISAAALFAQSEPSADSAPAPVAAAPAAQTPPPPSANAVMLFKRGEELFMQNKPAEAAPVLDAALREDPANVRTALYLGMAYLQQQKYDDAIAVYLKVLPRAGNEEARIAYNLGNAYYGKGNTDSAAEYYTRAIQADASYASAYLNRANLSVAAGNLKDALPDYELYLTLEPRSPKRPQIEQLMAFIREEFAVAEAKRLKEEEDARIAAEKRKKLLEEVASSLQADSGETQGLSAGSENVKNYEGEFELE